MMHEQIKRAGALLQREHESVQQTSDSLTKSNGWPRLREESNSLPVDNRPCPTFHEESAVPARAPLN